VAKRKGKFKRYGSRAKGFFGIKSVSDLATLIYSTLGISLLSDKIINTVNMQGTSFAKPLIAGAIAYFLPFRKESRLALTLLSVIIALGFSFQSLGGLGTAGKGQGVYGQKNIGQANVLGRLP
jgi:hypothetical protein